MNEARAKTENDVKLDLSVFDKALDHAQEASSGLPTSGITDNNNNNEKETREKGTHSIYVVIVHNRLTYDI
jgi:hypothetical protein